MSKKYKRQVRSNLASVADDRPGVSTPGMMTSRSQINNPPAFNPDYSYVIKDLRRIGLLVGTFVSILVILSFFLR
jgi:hypothetical protein